MIVLSTGWRVIKWESKLDIGEPPSDANPPATFKEMTMPRYHGKTAQLEAVNSPLATPDKTNSELNLQFIMRAAPTTPRFDYMFPALQDDKEALLPVTDQTVANLKRLGRAMSEANATQQPDSATPAAYTYFGQFLDHEITLTRRVTPGSMTGLNDPNLAPMPIDTVQGKIVNGRSPRLDLDCVYGLLPHGIPEFRDGDRMRLGKVSVTGNRPPGKDDFNDLNRRPPSTGPTSDRQAIIGADRNNANQ